MMKPHHLRMGLLLGFAAGMALLFQNCSNASFSSAESAQTLSESVDASGGPSIGAPSPTPNPNVICDPFDKKNIIDPKSGIEGGIYSTGMRLPAATCANGTQCSSRDYIAQGNKVNAALFMSRVYVPTRNFTEGFDANGTKKITDANNNTLFEWFALDLFSNFVLKDSDTAGMYQFAVISDDGATLSVAGQDILVSEGEHAPKLACASQITLLNKNEKLPFRLTYFQGPRTQISLVLMWRKVVPGQDLNDCGASDGYFTDPSQLPAELSAKGWSVLQPENFQLLAGTNLCVK